VLALTERVGDHDEVTSRQSPPADFPIYGLTEATWDGPRWLRFFEGTVGEVPEGIHLAHGRSEDLFADSGPWVEVRSLPRRRFTQDVDSHNDALSEVALYTWMSRGFGSEVHDELARIEASSYQDWSSVGWTLDDVEVEALVVPDHADAHGARAAFTATPEVYVVVAARGIRPADIRLTRVLDGSNYGMPFGASLDFPDSIKRSITKALGSVPRD
jgi:hypothetical protein